MEYLEYEEVEAEMEMADVESGVPTLRPRVYKSRAGNPLMADTFGRRYTAVYWYTLTALWQCVRRGAGCKARFITKTNARNQSDYQIERWICSKHNHRVDRHRTAAKAILARMKDKALTTDMSPSDIIQYEISGVDPKVLKHIGKKASVARLLRRYRQLAHMKQKEQNDAQNQNYTTTVIETQHQNSAAIEPQHQNYTASIIEGQHQNYSAPIIEAQYQNYTTTAVNELLKTEFNSDFSAPTETESPNLNTSNAEENILYVYKDDDGILRECHTDEAISKSSEIYAMLMSDEYVSSNFDNSLQTATPVEERPTYEQKETYYGQKIKQEPQTLTEKLLEMRTLLSRAKHKMNRLSTAPMLLKFYKFDEQTQTIAANKSSPVPNECIQRLSRVTCNLKKVSAKLQNTAMLVKFARMSYNDHKISESLLTSEDVWVVNEDSQDTIEEDVTHSSSDEAVIERIEDEDLNEDVHLDEQTGKISPKKSEPRKVIVLEKKSRSGNTIYEVIPNPTGVIIV